jgi:hypothetical protein
MATEQKQNEFDLSSLYSSANSPQLYVEAVTMLLRDGQPLSFRAPGRSMHPTVRGGDTITLKPVEPSGVRIRSNPLLLTTPSRITKAYLEEVREYFR